MARLHSQAIADIRTGDHTGGDKPFPYGTGESKLRRRLKAVLCLVSCVLCLPCVLLLFAPYSLAFAPETAKVGEIEGESNVKHPERPAVVHMIKPIYLSKTTKLEIVSDRPLRIKQVKLSKAGILQIEVFRAATSLPDLVSIDKGILRGVAFQMVETQYAISLQIYINLTEPVIYEVEDTDEGLMVVFQNPVLEQLVSLNINNESLSTVLLMLFMQYGANVVAGSGISGNVTAHLVDVPLKAALDEILGAEGYGYVEEGGLIRVLPVAELEAGNAAKTTREGINPSPTDSLETESKLFQLRFASVADMEPIIEKLVGSESTILTDQRTNSLIVISSPEHIRRTEEVISQLDRETAENEGAWKRGSESSPPQPLASSPPLLKRVFKLDYMGPNEAKAILEPLLSDEGTIEVVEKDKAGGTTGSGGAGGAMGGGASGTGMQLGESVGQGGYIVVSDREEILKEIEKEIARLDVPIPQVEIEAYIVEGTLSDDNELGIDWTAISKDEDVSLTFSRDGGAILTKGIIPVEKFMGVLNALTTRSDLRVLSNPRITTLEDQPATFHSGDKIPYSKIVIQDGIEQVETVFEDVGIVLAVTPQVKENDMISLMLSTSVSSEAGFTPSGQPRISTRTSQSQVLVKSGDTVAIAGLISEKSSIAVSKVPIIGDIPLIQRVFSTEREVKQRSEVTIFITPKIVAF
jgi:type II secretory pathway component GspD/PulD (secretin)